MAGFLKYPFPRSGKESLRFFSYLFSTPEVERSILWQCQERILFWFRANGMKANEICGTPLRECWCIVDFELCWQRADQKGLSGTLNETEHLKTGRVAYAKKWNSSGFTSVLLNQPQSFFNMFELDFWKSETEQANHLII